MHLFSIVLSTLVFGAEPAPEAMVAQGAVVKGVAYLEKEAERWKVEKKCASCHHIPMAMWTLHEARRAGYVVNDALLEQWTTWVLTDPQAGVIPDPEKKNPNYSGVELGAVYTSLALSAMPVWDDRARGAWDKIATHIVEKQTADGSFPTGMGRPPIMERPEGITLLAALALSAPACEVAKRKDAADSRARALKWLAEAPTGGSHQTLAIRLLLAARPGDPADAAKGLIDDLVSRQDLDGSWSQTPDMAGDALATGQSLYALRVAGLAAGDPVIRRGVAFLIKTQKPEGNWPMTSRPVLDQPTGGPAKDLTPITCAGSAWATVGLVRAAPR